MTEIPTGVAPPAAAVLTRGLRKRYGRTTVLAGVDLTVPERAFMVLVGANGAGKSTIMRILMDLVRANAGVAEVFGLRTTAGARVRARIGYLPEGHEEPYGWMRVAELLAHHGAYFPAWDGGYARHLVRALGLRTDERYGRLSKGEARRVQLVMALAHRPPLLLLDEPTDGLDLIARDRFLSLIAEHLADSPTTVLVATHVVDELEGLADHLAVLKGGRVTVQVPRDELEARLLCYTVDVAEGWTDADLNTAILRRNGGGREQRWTVWGREADIIDRVSAGGARVREVQRVSLEDAALALLTGEEEP